MIITKYAQSTVLIEKNEMSLLIDPGKYNFDDEKLNRNFFNEVDVLFITHKHADHYDLEAVKNIYNNSKPKIYTVKEISESLKNEGIESHIFSIGSKIEEGPFSIESIVTNHVVRDEKIDCFGMLVKSGKDSFYHTSDTLHITDKPTNCTVLMVPINNRGVCMGINDAITFSKEVKPQIVIPIHYDSPKDSHINPKEFVDKISVEGVNSKIMNFGDYLNVSQYSSPKNTE